MSTKHKLYWSTDGRNFHEAQNIEYLLARERQEIEDCELRWDQHEATKYNKIESKMLEYESSQVLT